MHEIGKVYGYKIQLRMNDNAIAGWNIPELPLQNNEGHQHILNARRNLAALQRANQARRNTVNNDINENMNTMENGERQHSTNSVSSLSNTTTNTQPTCISQVIAVCNELDKEYDCLATESLVKRCIKHDVWNNNKFLTDLSIQRMKVDDEVNEKSILNILLKFTRKTNLNVLNRLKFWKKYGWVVQKELNKMKTICTQLTKDEIMRGML